MAFEKLFEKYDNLVFFDTETTGLYPDECQIIEIAGVKITRREGRNFISQRTDDYVCMREGKSLPAEIVKLTGITKKELSQRGKDEREAILRFGKLCEGNTLLCAYNAHFDLNFLVCACRHEGLGKLEKRFSEIDVLDALSVYRDRRNYPHKLSDAVTAYNLDYSVANTHRANDDAYALCAVAAKMDGEREDLWRYINIFGYNEKYGAPVWQFKNIKYLPQKGVKKGRLERPLYEESEALARAKDQITLFDLGLAL